MTGFMTRGVIWKFIVLTIKKFNDLTIVGEKIYWHHYGGWNVSKYSVLYKIPAAAGSRNS